MAQVEQKKIQKQSGSRVVIPVVEEKVSTASTPLLGVDAQEAETLCTKFLRIAYQTTGVTVPALLIGLAKKQAQDKAFLPGGNSLPDFTEKFKSIGLDVAVASGSMFEVFRTLGIKDKDDALKINSFYRAAAGISWVVGALAKAWGEIGSIKDVSVENETVNRILACSYTVVFFMKLLNDLLVLTKRSQDPQQTKIDVAAVALRAAKDAFIGTAIFLGLDPIGKNTLSSEGQGGILLAAAGAEALTGLLDAASKLAQCCCKGCCNKKAEDSALDSVAVEQPHEQTDKWNWRGTKGDSGSVEYVVPGSSKGLAFV